MAKWHHNHNLSRAAKLLPREKAIWRLIKKDKEALVADSWRTLSLLSPRKSSAQRLYVTRLNPLSFLPFAQLEL